MTRPDLHARLSARPIIVAEALGRARSWGLPVAMMVYVSLLGGVALGLFWFAISRAPQHQPAPADMANVAFFAVALQLVIVLLSVPALAASALAGERERGTLDVLQLGRVSPRRLVLDKLVASLAVPALLGVAAVPVLVAVFLYAGVGLPQLLLAEVVTLVAAVAVGAVSMALSAWLPRALPAAVAAYAAMLIVYPGGALAGVVLSHIGDGSSVHPLVFANPFYALHALAFPELAWGVDLGRLVQLLVLGRGEAASWGTVVQPWPISVLSQLALAAACLLAASELAAGRRLATRSLTKDRGPQR